MEEGMNEYMIGVKIYFLIGMAIAAIVLSAILRRNIEQIEAKEKLRSQGWPTVSFTVLMMIIVWPIFIAFSFLSLKRNQNQ